MSAIPETSSYRSTVRLLILHFLSRVLSFSWLRPNVLFAWDLTASTRSTNTSWLDGLRGVASLQVFFFHFFGRYTKWDRTFGSTPEDRYIHQLPPFRSIWGAGSSAVSVFFVISGYALTVKSLTLLRRKQYDDLYKGLCSSLIRRGFRLYLPLILLAIPMLFLIRTVNMVRDGYVYKEEIKDSWHMQFVHVVNATDDHINPFMYADNNPTRNRFAYVPQSWTIPMEYHGSIVVYLLCMVVSRIELFKTRCTILVVMMLYALHRGSWWTSNFIVGMLLADWGLEQQSTKNKPITRNNKALGILRKAGYIIMFSIGYYLAGMPPEHMAYDFDPQPKPGYEFLYKISPNFYMFRFADEARWYWSWSGVFTVVSISQLPSMRTILETRVCQWLGKLSFALYLIHASIIAALSTPLQEIVSMFTENKGILCLIEFSIIAPLVFAMSGVVERYIDRPSVRFAKMVEVYLWQERPLEVDEFPLTLRDVA